MQQNIGLSQANIMRVELLINVFLIMKAARSIQKRRPVRSVIWGALSLLMSRNLANGMNSFSSIIHAIHLHEDGLKVDLTFQDSSFRTVMIQDIQRISEGAKSGEDQISEVNLKNRIAAFQEHQRRYGHLSSNFMPILVEGKLLCLDQVTAFVQDMEILDAVTKGIPIQTNLMMEKERLTGSITSTSDQIPKERPLWIDITNIQPKDAL